MLLVVLDSLAAGHASGPGSARDTTPHLAALAARGLLVRRAYAPTAWTVPSVASLLTGLEQERHGLRHLGGRLPASRPTLAEAFRQAGYSTLAFFQNPLLEGTGLERGFESARVFDWDQPEEAVQAAIAALGDRTGPWMAYVHLAPPHMPYLPPAPWRHSYAPLEPIEVDGTVASCRAIHRAGLLPDDPRVAALSARYDENVRYADALLGRLLDALGASTLVAVTSDHGEAFMEHGAQGHNATVYEEMVRVPLVLAGPGLPAGRALSSPVTLLDVGPTLLDLCGLPARLGRGQSFLAPGPASKGPPRWIFLSARYKADPDQLAFGLVQGLHKLVVDAGAAALYDLAADPGETFDVSGEHPDEAAALARAATAFWRERVPASEPEADLSERTTRALRALGYLDASVRRKTR